MKKQIDEETTRNLSGLNGLVYLMFVGEERYAEQFRGDFVKLSIIKNAESVNQAIARLRKTGLLKYIRKLPKRGAPTLYTANLEPLKQTSQLLLPIASDLFEHEEAHALSRLIFEYFPRFVSIEKKHFGYDIRLRSWYDTAKTFVNFIIMIGADFALEKYPLPKPLGSLISLLAPFTLFSKDFEQGKHSKMIPLFEEWSDLKKEILETMTPMERSFFEMKISAINELDITR